MAIISTTDYKSIMTDYADAQTQLDGISDKYFDAAYTVLVTNVFDPEIDLLIAFHNAYIVSQGTYASAPSSAINAVNSLQNHILAQGVSAGNNGAPAAGEKYDDINDFYLDDGTFTSVIPQSFANMSSQSGHTIESAYIAP